jgi:hypothetical protein
MVPGCSKILKLIKIHVLCGVYFSKGAEVDVWVNIEANSKACLEPVDQERGAISDLVSQCHR